MGELTAAVSARGMKMGFYYSSLLDWSFTPRPVTSLADLLAGSDTEPEYLDYVEAHWHELIERYEPSILWSDIGYPPGYNLPAVCRLITTATRTAWSTTAGCRSPASSSRWAGPPRQS